MATNRKMETVLNTLDDLTGKTFGLLTVVKRVENDKFGNVYWYCRCVCGELKAVRASTIRAGKFFTCGNKTCRFWEKVRIAPGDDCWEWTGALKDTGYGVFKEPGQKKNVLAHVYSYELHHGIVLEGDGHWIRHQCD